MKFEVIEASEQGVFKALDDALFWAEITKEELKSYEPITTEFTEIDGFVSKAIERALNITLP